MAEAPSPDKNKEVAFIGPPNVITKDVNEFYGENPALNNISI